MNCVVLPWNEPSRIHRCLGPTGLAFQRTTQFAGPQIQAGGIATDDRFVRTTTRENRRGAQAHRAIPEPQDGPKCQRICFPRHPCRHCHPKRMRASVLPLMELE